MDNNLNILNPENILVDDRSTKDLINYINKLSDNLYYYNSKNKVDGFFSSMVNTNESFLISEISSFEIINVSIERLSLIKKFDNSNNYIVRKKILKKYIELIDEMFFVLDTWFEKSRKNNFSSSDDTVQEDLELTIENDSSILLLEFKQILESCMEMKIIEKNNSLNIYNFNSIVWKNKTSITQKKIKLSKNKNQIISLLFKQFVLVSNNLYKTLFNIIKRSEKKLNLSLNTKNNNPHVGLIFTFLKLFEHLQNDINKICKKHLDFYFEKILLQKRKETDNIKTFITIDIDEKLEFVNIDKGSKLIAGQYQDGSNIIFETNDDVVLNNVKICYLMTIFLSRNNKFNYNSRFKIVSSIFSKVIANDILDVENFNKNNSLFSILGKDQNLLIKEDQTMNFADLGFIISSPSLKIQQSNRIINIDFYFDSNSIQRLTDLIIDISNHSKLNEQEVFFKVFSKSFNVFYTKIDGWEKIDDFEVLFPNDWSLRKITFVLKVEKLKPSFSNFNKNIHNKDLNAHHPLLEFRLNQSSFYNTYSFFNSLNLEKIDINIDVKNLKQLKFYRDGQSLPVNSEIDIFGAIPKYGSKLYISCEELFNKNVKSAQIKWDYTNLFDIDNNFKNYYEKYNLEVENNIFKFKLSALSDFKFVEKSNLDFNMFDIEKSSVKNSKKIKLSNFEDLQIHQNYFLNNGSINDFSNDLETGLIKLELISPKFGFGHNEYPRIQSKLLINQANNENPDENDNFLNEPFSPKATNFSIDYTANSSLIFKESDRIENNFDQKNNFFLISPYGIEKTFSKKQIKSSMLYNFENDGELIIGFESKNKINNLDILFEIHKNENTDYEFSRKITWYYFSYDEWKEINYKNILFDQTNNLVRTGIISFRMPLDLSNNHKILKKEKYFIKATSKDKADQFGLIKSIETNAVAISQIKDKIKKNRISSLSAGSVSNFQSEIKGVVSINQPLSSPKVKLFETDMEYYKRVSELIKHKKRPVSSSDYQQFILNEFSWLSYVNCYYNSHESNLTILCLKKIEFFQNIDEIKLSFSEINEIKNYLSNYVSPFAKLDIVNPVFEDLWIKCKIIFKNIPNGKGIEKLNKAIFDYICPLSATSNNLIKIKSKIKKIDLLNYIKSKSYVAFVTGFSIVHFRRNIDNSISVIDTASEDIESDFIEKGGLKSVIVPRNHKFDILTREEYHKPEKTSFKDLQINKSFLINDQDNLNSVNKINSNEIEKFDNLQFILKF